MSSEFFLVIFDLALNTVGLGYPIWRSYKVVEARKYDDELIQWLTFWVLSSCLNKAEDFLHFTCFTIRGYFLYKLTRLLFITWMIHPKYKGALFLYYCTIEKFF